MKAIKIRNYNKSVEIKDKNGIGTGEFKRQPVWVYALLGQAEELEAYERIQEAEGNNFHKAKDGKYEGQPLYFAPQFLGETATIGISKNPETGVERVFVDDSKEQEMLSVAEKYKGTAVGDHLSKNIADHLFGSLLGAVDTSAPQATSAEAEEEASADPAETDIDQP